MLVWCGLSLESTTSTYCHILGLLNSTCRPSRRIRRGQSSVRAQRLVWARLSSMMSFLGCWTECLYSAILDRLMLAVYVLSHGVHFLRGRWEVKDLCSPSTEALNLVPRHAAISAFSHDRALPLPLYPWLRGSWYVSADLLPL